MVQGHRGRPPLAAKREQFGRLIARGIGNAEACRIVGVHPKTGKRWRRGRVMTSSSGARLHYAPVIDTSRQVISQRYLSEDDRVAIADLRGDGFGVRAIAARLGRSPSTVSRELHRNRDPLSLTYRPFAAQMMAARRRAGPAAASCYAIGNCASTWQAGWQCGGARSRSARRCAVSSPVTPGGTWSTRRSTRRSTGQSWAGCARTCGRYCAPGGGTASGTAVLMPAGPGCSQT